MEQPKKEPRTQTVEEYWAWYNEKVYPHLLGLFAWNDSRNWYDGKPKKEEDSERRKEEADTQQRTD